MNVKSLRCAERPLFTAFAELIPTLDSGRYRFRTAVPIMELQPQFGYYFENFSVTATCGKEVFYRAVSGQFTFNLITQATHQVLTKKPLIVNALEIWTPAEYFWRSTQPSNPQSRTDIVSIHPNGTIDQTAEILSLGVVPKIRISFVVYEIMNVSYNQYQSGGR